MKRLAWRRHSLTSPRAILTINLRAQRTVAGRSHSASRCPRPSLCGGTALRQRARRWRRLLAPRRGRWGHQRQPLPAVASPHATVGYASSHVARVSHLRRQSRRHWRRPPQPLAQKEDQGHSPARLRAGLGKESGGVSTAGAPVAAWRRQKRVSRRTWTAEGAGQAGRPEPLSH